MFLTEAVSKVGGEMHKRLDVLEHELLKRLPLPNGSLNDGKDIYQQHHSPSTRIANTTIPVEQQSRSVYNHIPGVKSWKDAIKQWKMDVQAKL